VRAKFIDRNNRTPFATHSSSRNNQFSGKYPLSRLQYEDADKSENDDETLDEKFIEETDPISDMEIGGIDFEEVYRRISDDTAKKWVKTLNDTLKGKTIRCIADKWGGRRGDWQEYIIKVKDVVNTPERDGFSTDIAVRGDNGDIYTILTDRKVYVIKE
jgi:hypothetical protein